MELGFMETALILMISWIETAMIWIVVLMLLGKSFKELVDTDYYIHLTLWVAGVQTFTSMSGMDLLSRFLLTIMVIIIYNYYHVKKNIVH